MLRRGIAPSVLVLAVLAVFLVPGIALGHSELESSDPAAGATLPAAPTEIGGDFSEEMDASRSSMELRGPDGSTVATGGVPVGGPATRMVISPLPALAPGVYEVRWTTVTADDDGVERGTFSFTVVEASAAPTSSSATTPAPGTTAAPDATASPPPAPSSSPSPSPTPAAGAGDLLLPVVVLLAVLGVGAAVLLRRRR